MILVDYRYPSWPLLYPRRITQVCTHFKLTDFAVRPEPRFTAVVLGAVV